LRENKKIKIFYKFEEFKEEFIILWKFKLERWEEVD